VPCVISRKDWGWLSAFGAEARIGQDGAREDGVEAD
jgi:hypothetical protein